MPNCRSHASRFKQTSTCIQSIERLHRPTEVLNTPEQCCSTRPARAAPCRFRIRMPPPPCAPGEDGCCIGARPPATGRGMSRGLACGAAWPRPCRHARARRVGRGRNRWRTSVPAKPVAALGRKAVAATPVTKLRGRTCIGVAGTSGDGACEEAFLSPSRLPHIHSLLCRLRRPELSGAQDPWIKLSPPMQVCQSGFQ